MGLTSREKEQFDTTIIPNDVYMEVHMDLVYLETLFNTEEINKALKSIDKIIDKHGEYDYFMSLKAKCLVKMGQKEEGLEIVEKMLNEIILDENVLCNISFVLERTGNAERIREIYENALKYNKSNKTLYNVLINFFISRGDYCSAQMISFKMFINTKNENYLICSALFFMAAIKTEMSRDCKNPAVVLKLLITSIQTRFLKKLDFGKDLEVLIIFVRLIETSIDISNAKESKSPLDRMAPLEPNSFITAFTDFLKTGKQWQMNRKLMGYEMYQILYSVLIKSGDFESASKLSVEYLAFDSDQLEPVKNFISAENLKIDETSTDKKSIFLSNLTEKGKESLNTETLCFANVLTVLAENQTSPRTKSRTDFLVSFWIISAFSAKKALFSDIIAVFEEFSAHFLAFFERFGDKRNFVDDVNPFLKRFEKALSADDGTEGRTLKAKKAIVEKMSETVESGIFETEKRKMVAVLNAERIKRKLGLVSLKPAGSLLKHCRYLLQCFQKAEKILPDENDMNGAEDFLILFVAAMIDLNRKSKDRRLIFETIFVLRSALKKHQNATLQFLLTKLSLSAEFATPLKTENTAKLMKSLLLESLSHYYRDDLERFCRSDVLSDINTRHLKFFRTSLSSSLEAFVRFAKRRRYVEAFEILVFLRKMMCSSQVAAARISLLKSKCDPMNEKGAVLREDAESALTQPRHFDGAFDNGDYRVLVRDLLPNRMQRPPFLLRSLISSLTAPNSTTKKLDSAFFAGVAGKQCAAPEKFDLVKNPLCNADIVIQMAQLKIAKALKERNEPEFSLWLAALREKLLFVGIDLATESPNFFDLGNWKIAVHLAELCGKRIFEESDKKISERDKHILTEFDTLVRVLGQNGASSVYGEKLFRSLSFFKNCVSFFLDLFEASLANCDIPIKSPVDALINEICQKIVDFCKSFWKKPEKNFFCQIGFEKTDFETTVVGSSDAEKTAFADFLKKVELRRKCDLARLSQNVADALLSKAQSLLQKTLDMTGRAV